MNPYEDLAAGIILRAVQDYKIARKSLQKKCNAEKKMNAAYEIERIERFFKSAWFGKLTKLDGKTILERLRNEM